MARSRLERWHPVRLALAAQQAVGQPMNGGAVARRLRMRPAQLSQYRARLIEKGTIVAEGDALSFVLPAMAAYVLRAPDAARPDEVDERWLAPALLAIRPIMRPVRARHRRSSSPR